MKRRYPRVRRVFLVCGGLLLALVGFSYARALLAPNSPGWDLRSAEWLRDNHAGWALDVAEWCWLKVHKPSGAELHTRVSEFPAPFARQRDGLAERPVEPPPIAVLFDKPLPGEGVWRSIGSTVNGVPALRCSSFRPDTERPDVTVGVARFTPELTRFVLVPGTRDPAGDWRWHGSIPEEQRQSVLAAFNAGFRLHEARGGFYAEGRLARPLVAGAASIIVDQKGALDIVAWPADRELTADVAGVRQNLLLIVADGEVSSGLDQNRDGAWGSLHGGYMWRSGLGIARDGGLFYLAGHGLTLGSLANALKHVGAVRAMQLDIHQQWPSFNVFQPTSGENPKLIATKLLEDMRHPARRYLKPDDRDFVAAFVR